MITGIAIGVDTRNDTTSVLLLDNNEEIVVETCGNYKLGESVQLSEEEVENSQN